MAQEAKPLLDGPGPATKEEKANGYTVTNANKGNGADYLTRRIARDAPDILDRMKAGDFKSVRAAARRQPQT
jgi:hypothetical protein